MSDENSLCRKRGEKKRQEEGEEEGIGVKTKNEERLRQEIYRLWILAKPSRRVIYTSIDADGGEIDRAR